MDTYEVLVVEDGIYYIRYYPCGLECKGINLKLDEDNYENFIIGKVEM